MRTQEAIIELLEKESLPIAKIAGALAISEGYIRTTIKSMELTGMVEKVDDRLPYYYRISESRAHIDRDRVNKLKKQLMLPLEDKDGKLITMLKDKSKSLWVAAAEELDAISAAIKELDSEDKLHDTL